MSHESMNPFAPDQAEVNLDESSHTDYTLFELKDIVRKGDAALAESFQTREADPISRELAVAHYERILNDPEAFVGIGNTALVFKQHPDAEQSERCVKCRWDFLMVNNKSKKNSALPENLQRLKKIENHFDKVNQNKKAGRGKGLEVVPDNSVLREALIQRIACRAMGEAGMAGRIPDIDFIVRIEREESGDVGGDPFGASETVNMMFMEQVQGMNLEEVIYQASADVAARLDVEAFGRELKEMLAILHKEGIAHRDLTIRNIMLGSEDLKPRIIDFGRSACSEALAEEDMRDDLSSADEAIRFMKRFKADPQAAAAELKDMQKDWLVSR